MMTAIRGFKIIAKDSRNLGKFYADVFEWKPSYDEMAPAGPFLSYDLAGAGPYVRYTKPIAGDAWMSVQDQLHSGSWMDDGKAVSGITGLIFVQDVPAALQRFVEYGGTKIAGPDHHPGFCDIAMGRDPEGNMITLWAPLAPVDEWETRLGIVRGTRDER